MAVARLAKRVTIPLRMPTPDAIVLPVLRELRPGERIRRLGVLVACEPTRAGPIAGLSVRAHGTALEEGLLALRRARARPFSARLSPWEGAGWEHALPVDSARGTGACVLRAATVGRAGDGALPGAVYVELEGTAALEGCGTLELRVEPLGRGASGSVVACFDVRVQSVSAREVWSAYVAFEAAPVGVRMRNVARVLARWARLVGTLPAGPRVLSARGVAPERVGLREGCVVLGGRPSLAGDARWDALRVRAFHGGLDQLTLVPPGGVARAGDVLEVALCRRARFGPGPYEMALSIGRARLPSDPTRLLRALAASLTQPGEPQPVHAFVAGHDWVPSLLELTPWERAAGREPARTLDALATVGRVEPGEAWRLVGARAVGTGEAGDAQNLRPRMRARAVGAWRND